MGQDWKTLILVAAGAAIAGWLVVRMLAAGAPAPGNLQPVAVTSSPQGEAKSEVASNREPSEATPAHSPRPTTAATAGDDESGGDLTYVTRDLEALAQALAKAQRGEDHVMPRINDGLDVPSAISYRRRPDFWQPLLGDSTGAKR